jgi:hypothetical protein
MRWLGFIVTIVVGGLLALSCTPDDGSSNGPEPCDSHLDCPIELVCRGGFCIKPDCKDDSECPISYTCLSTGVCSQNPPECMKDEDCKPEQTCIANKCKGGGECEDGQIQPCFIGCHEGTRICTDEFWTDCSAAPLLQGEACGNNIDDDCNGETDEGCVQCTDMDPPIHCSSPCGDGEQTCFDGTWSECSAPDDCLCDTPGEVEDVDCGMCGSMTRTCQPVDQTGMAMWEEFGQCNGEGSCEPQTEEEEACGAGCGYQLRICQDDCNWSDWTECQDTGVCIPGQTEDKACGNCGNQTKLCGDNCMWEVWGNCQEGEGCKLGETKTQDCGMCGSSTKYCETNCTWGDWGECEGEGSCEPGEKESEPCGYCGIKTRECSFACQWGSFSSCQTGGECSPAESEIQPCGPTTEQGVCEKGQQTRTCNSSCMWNSWGSCLGATYPQSEVCGDTIDQDCDGQDKKQPDQYEPNNSCYSCYEISGEDPEVTLYPTFDSIVSGHDKDDYFCITVVDNWDLPFTHENIVVELTNQPLGGDGDLALYKGYSNCNNDDAVATTMVIGSGDEKIDWQETGDPDDGTFIIRVRNYSEIPNCSKPYTLKIKGLK